MIKMYNSALITAKKEFSEQQDKQFGMATWHLPSLLRTSGVGELSTFSLVTVLLTMQV